MTIDELRSKKRELLARKKHETELQAAGMGDELSLALINEELLEVSAQLKSLAPSHKPRHEVVSDSYSYGGSRIDRQQFLEWSMDNMNDDDASDEVRAIMRGAINHGIETLTERQRTVLTMWSGGMRGCDIAKELGVHKSTVSRTLNRALEKVKKSANYRMAVEEYQKNGVLDLSDPKVAKSVIESMTAHQAICFYLFYSEWLSVTEIGEVLGKNKSTISRTIKKAMENVSRSAGKKVTGLENVEALDDLVYSVYCRLCAEPDSIPELVHSHMKASAATAANTPTVKGKYTLRCSGVNYTPEIHIQSVFQDEGHGTLDHDQHGLLLQVLLGEQNNSHDGKEFMRRWLFKIFTKLTKKIGGGSNGKTRVP